MCVSIDLVVYRHILNRIKKVQANKILQQKQEILKQNTPKNTPDGMNTSASWLYFLLIRVNLDVTEVLVHSGGYANNPSNPFDQDDPFGNVTSDRDILAPYEMASDVDIIF